MITSKRNKVIAKSFDKNKEYSITDAIKIIKDNSKVKFAESLDVAIRLGVDPRHADQMVRGTVSLPNGTGKQVRVLVIAKGAKAQEALDAGADYAGFEEYLEKIKALAYWERKRTKDVIDEVLGCYLKGKRIKKEG